MLTPEITASHGMNELPIGDIAAVGDELTDDDLLLAVGGLWRVDVEVVSYDENGKVVDHEINVFYV